VASDNQIYFVISRSVQKQCSELLSHLGIWDDDGSEGENLVRESRPAFVLHRAEDFMVKRQNDVVIYVD